MQLAPTAAPATERVQRTPADLGRVATAIENAFTGTYADRYENQALPIALATERTGAELVRIATAAGTAFQADDQRFAAFVTGVRSTQPARLVAQTMVAADGAFTGTYADQYENKALELALGSRNAAEAPRLLGSVGGAFQDVAQRFAAFGIVANGARSAADVAPLLSGIDAGFDGTYADQYEVQALTTAMGSVRPGADLGRIARLLNGSFQTDELRAKAFTLDAANPARSYADLRSIHGGIDALFSGTYADQYELKAAQAVVPGQVSTSGIVAAARAAGRMAQTDDQRLIAFNTLLANTK
ncbi:MAG: hypothetical protein JWN72_1878 [Thermoleophilia bacterium]|nr:hypothetical protein [Thermoleophilia bacterium]